MDEMQLVPQWLESLLSTSFFTVCPRHEDSPKNECNMYCLDCKNGAFCLFCRSSRHKDHPVIQIRRSSYHDVVRVAEIQEVLDVTGVQTYVINGARVLFLNERPHPKSNGSTSTSSSKGVSHVCEICGRGLLDPLRFCSLGCKLAGVKKNTGRASFMLSEKNVNEEGTAGEGRRRVLLTSKEEELREGRKQQEIGYPSTPPPTHTNSRRRKGIPHRAPFGS